MGDRGIGQTRVSPPAEPGAYLCELSGLPWVFTDRITEKRFVEVTGHHGVVADRGQAIFGEVAGDRPGQCRPPHDSSGRLASLLVVAPPAPAPGHEIEPVASILTL